MNQNYVNFRIEFARLLGLCDSAHALKEYNVPQAWINELRSQANKCNDLCKDQFGKFTSSKDGSAS